MSSSCMTQVFNTSFDNAFNFDRFLEEIYFCYENSLEELNNSKEFDFPKDLGSNNLNEKSVKEFLGDYEESTEIDSIVITLDQNVTLFNKTGLKIFEEETEEILQILRRKPNTSKNINGLSRSNPQLKKISLAGKVLSLDNTNKTPIQPERVSNPIFQYNKTGITNSEN